LCCLKHEYVSISNEVRWRRPLLSCTPVSVKMIQMNTIDVLILVSCHPCLGDWMLTDKENEWIDSAQNGNMTGEINICHQGQPGVI
jgi:hypothetical protein